MTQTSPNTKPCTAANAVRLAVFTRYPQPGTTKTRLIPALGASGAADLQRDMTRHTLRWARRLASSGEVSPTVYFEGGSQSLMRETFGPDLPYVPQGPGDLGDRLSRVFGEWFASGAARAVIVGSDCPGLDADLVRQAIDRLADVDLVLGPATDGGYTLIALRRQAAALFDGVPWGSQRVLEVTRGKAHALGLSVALLPELCDVDRPEDLHVWTESQPAGGERISVIIPTLYEHPDELAEVLQSAKVEQDAVETILVAAEDNFRGGQGLEAAWSAAESLGARVIKAPRGRASQMNAGAAAADGDILLFLHADTRLPHGFQRHVRRLLEDPKVSLGAFRLAIDSPHRVLRLIERGANLRAGWLQRPWGDQALFLRATTFHQLGRFADMPILEDADLVGRLRTVGRVAIAPAAVVTSARRWNRLGVWRTFWLTQFVLAGHCMGVSPQRLARWYYGKEYENGHP